MTQTLYGLDWRLEAPIASRKCQPTSAVNGEAPQAERVAPTFSLQLTTQGQDGSLQTTWLSCDYETLNNIAKGLEDAATALRSPAYRRIHKMVK